MKSARATSTKRRAAKVERVVPNALGASEASWGQAAPPLCQAAWLARLLQAGDSFYPTGSYAHSFGLEGLAQEGVVRDRETLRKFLFLSVLPSLRRTELPLAAHAWRAFAKPDWARVEEISLLSSALKTAIEARAAAGNIGRQRAELAASLHAHPLAQEYLRRAVAGDWPFSPAISAALEGRVISAPLAAVLAGAYYATVASLLAAAMKLLRLGQNGCQTLLTEAMAQAPADIAAATATPFEEIGWFNPWLDIAAARHETADGRLFIS
jgi:urease accessory protein